MGVLEAFKDMHGVTYIVHHLYREGNQAVEWLSWDEECRITKRYTTRAKLPTSQHGLLCLEKIGLPYIHFG